MTPQIAIQIKNTCSAALALAATQTDADDKYDTIRNAYDQVRTLQEGVEETDHAETPRAAMEEYLEASETNIDAMLTEMYEQTKTMDVIPDPIPEGIVFVASGGSGSGS